MTFRDFIPAIAALLLLAPVRLSAQDANPYLYQGADRAQKLVAGAKKEGVASWHTTFTAQDAKVITDAFEQRYGVKVTTWRTRAEKIVQRLVTEARAGRHEADVVEMDDSEMEALRREKLLAEFFSPSFKDLPPEVLPKHRYYAPIRFNIFTLAYNTRLVKPDDVPNSYEDLLQPKWAGRLGIESTDVPWFASVVKAMGEEQGLRYFKKLAAMKPDMRTSHILVAELVAAGEIPLVITAYNHNVETLKRKGAPVEWKPLPPTFGAASAVGVMKQAPHPHAALLFADFLLSKEGQELIQSLNRVPTSRAVDSPLNKFPYRVIEPAVVLDEMDRWEKIWTDLFLKGQAIKKE
jgi:iron(III) transport system substrate-binding protein